MKNELAEDEVPPESEYQTLEASGAFKTGKNQQCVKCLYPLSLCQKKTLKLINANYSLAKKIGSFPVVRLVNYCMTHQQL